MYSEENPLLKLHEHIMSFNIVHGNSFLGLFKSLATKVRSLYFSCKLEFKCI